MGISQIPVNGHYASKQKAREQLARESYTVERKEYEHLLCNIGKISFSDIDAAMKRRHLTFEEAFVGACYVLHATNAEFARQTEDLFGATQAVNFVVAGREFLNGMAVKEAWGELTADEIAGMVSAAQLDIIVRPAFSNSIIETCGTGGDVGFFRDGRSYKTINVSTLSALVLAAVGVPTLKHGSYANTSAVGSTDAVEQFGTVVEQSSLEEIEKIFASSKFYFSDAHVFKTIHDLSHLPPRHETINHLLGPMTTPVDRETILNKVMGVNEKVHPAVVAQAFEQMGQRGIQCIGNVAVVCGLDSRVYLTQADHRTIVKKHAILDELSPYSSVVAFVVDGRFRGVFALQPEDFGVSFAGRCIELENQKETLHRINRLALQGRDSTASDYLAMNAALGLYLAEYASRPGMFDHRGPKRSALHECFKRCRDAIQSAHPYELLRQYVLSTGGKFQ